MNYWSPTQSSVYQLAERQHGKHWHLIDYVIVRRKDRQDVRVTKTMCGADCWTDHRLVVSKLNLRIQPVRRPQGKYVPKKLDVSKLKQDSKRQAFVNDLCSRLDAQFRRCRWELDSLQRHRSLFSNGFTRTSISQTPRFVWWEWQKNSGIPWRETPKTQGLPQEYQLSI